MKISEIENGVPIPKGYSKMNPLIHKNAARMQVGHSFVVTFEEGDFSTARGIGCSLACKFRGTNKKFKTGKISESQIRIWRVE